MHWTCLSERQRPPVAWGSVTWGCELIRQLSRSLYSRTHTLTQQQHVRQSKKNISAFLKKVTRYPHWRNVEKSVWSSSSVEAREPLNNEVDDTTMCFCVWREKCSKSFLSLSNSARLWSCDRVFMYIMYIVVHTECGILRTGFLLRIPAVGTEIFDVHRDAKSQPKVCFCMCVCVSTWHTHTWMCVYNTARLAWIDS